MDVLTDILKDSSYALNLFKLSEIQALRERIVFRETRGDRKPHVTCLIRNKEILLKPEEIVRQLYLSKLINHYNYPKNKITVEHPVSFGRQTKYADIVVFDRDRPMVEYIIVELKKPKLQDGKNQLRSYCNATGAPIGVWTNGSQISYYNRKDPNYFEDITDIPNANQTLADILQERFTLKDLILRDKIPNEGKSLKLIIQEMEDEVLANAGVDVFEEVFKLIFTKLYVDDYPIFFAVSEKAGKDNSGDYVYLKNSNGKPKLDKNGHLIVDHDLHNHNVELPDGIAEAFIEFAKSEGLSFGT